LISPQGLEIGVLPLRFLRKCSSAIVVVSDYTLDRSMHNDDAKSDEAMWKGRSSSAQLPDSIISSKSNNTSIPLYPWLFGLGGFAHAYRSHSAGT